MNRVKYIHQKIRNLTSYNPDFSVIDTSPLDSSNSKGRVDFLKKHSIISTPSKASGRERVASHVKETQTISPRIERLQNLSCSTRSLTQLYLVESIQFWQLCDFGQKSGREEPGKSGNSGELSQTLDLLFGLGEEVFFVFPPLQVKMRSSDGQLGLGKAAVHGS